MFTPFGTRRRLDCYVTFLIRSDGYNIREPWTVSENTLKLHSSVAGPLFYNMKYIYAGNILKKTSKLAILQILVNHIASVGRKNTNIATN